METPIKLGLRPFYTPTGRVYAIGDVHGEAQKLKNLLEQLREEIKPEDHVVFVGDLVDAGPDTPGVLLLIQEFINWHPNTFVIMGNHEEMMLLALKGDPNWWLVNGGGLNKEGFQAREITTFPEFETWLIENAITFLENLIPYYETETLLITHAPFNEKMNKAYALEEGVLEKNVHFLRWRFTDNEKTAVLGLEGKKLFVCGHQHKFKQAELPRFYPEENRIFIDTGAGYEANAPLACVVVYPFVEIRTILG